MSLASSQAGGRAACVRSWPLNVRRNARAFFGPRDVFSRQYVGRRSLVVDETAQTALRENHWAAMTWSIITITIDEWLFLSGHAVTSAKRPAGPSHSVMHERDDGPTSSAARIAGAALMPTMVSSNCPSRNTAFEDDRCPQLIEASVASQPKLTFTSRGPAHWNSSATCPCSWSRPVLSRVCPEG